MADNPLDALMRVRHNAHNYSHYWRGKRDYIKFPGTLDSEWREKFAEARNRGEPLQINIGTAIARYLEVIAPFTRRRSDQRKLRNSLFRFCDFMGYDIPLRSITPSMLSEYRDKLIARGLRGSSTNSYMWDLNSVMVCARDNWELIDVVPRLKMFRIRTSISFLTEKEERRLVAQCQPPLLNLVRFILGTGARKGEAVNLTWDDLVLHPEDNQRPHVLFRNTKNGQPNAVPLPNYVTEMLKRMRPARHTDMPYVFTFLPKKDSRDEYGHLVQEVGVPAQYSRPDNHFRIARDRAGLPHITIHGLRHTYATRLISKGASMVAVNRLLNHKTADSTLIYSHLTTKQLDRTIDVLDQKSRGKTKRKARSNQKRKKVSKSRARTTR